MAEKALTVAKYIISGCSQAGRPVTGLALQKMLYDTQKSSLCMTGKPLFSDNFEAWDLGPIIPDVYWYFCGFGSMPIDMEYDVHIDSADRELIDRIIEQDHLAKPWKLAEAMQKKGGAWEKVYADGRGRYLIIPKEMIRKME